MRNKAAIENDYLHRLAMVQSLFDLMWGTNQRLEGDEVNRIGRAGHQAAQDLEALFYELWDTTPPAAK